MTDGRPPPRPRARGRQAGPGALADQVALELGQRGEDVEDEASAARGRVDALLEAPEADVALGQRRDGIDQVAQRSPESVKTPDHERVAGSQVVERAGELGPLFERAARGV